MWIFQQENKLEIVSKVEAVVFPTIKKSLHLLEFLPPWGSTSPSDTAWEVW